jgi:hypothetical protein
MDVSNNASKYMKIILKIKLAKWGTLIKIFKKVI